MPFQQTRFLLEHYSLESSHLSLCLTKSCSTSSEYGDF